MNNICQLECMRTNADKENKAVIREILIQFSQLLRNQSDDSVFEPRKEQVWFHACMWNIASSS